MTLMWMGLPAQGSSFCRKGSIKRLSRSCQTGQEFRQVRRSQKALRHAYMHLHFLLIPFLRGMVHEKKHPPESHVLHKHHRGNPRNYRICLRNCAGRRLGQELLPKMCNLRLAMSKGNIMCEQSCTTKNSTQQC